MAEEDISDPKRVYLFHGFNIKDGGRTTVGRMAEPLTDMGFNPKVVSNGFFHLRRVRLCNKGLATAIAAMARPDSIAIAHSNAASIIWMACNMGAKFRKVVLINPALDRSRVMAPSVKQVQVWHSTNDWWTNLSRLIPFSPWGGMGTHGPTFDDPRYHVVDQGKFFGQKVHHSDVFDEPLFTPFIGQVANFLSED